MQITTMGLDIAKHVFHLVVCDGRGKVVKKKRLRRGQLLSYFAQLPVSLVGMEGCASAHYWARALTAQGHRVDLLLAQYVKGYVRGNKNDYNDALAIAEAVRGPEMRRVPIKTAAQQDIQALHRLREGQIKMRTAHANRIRGLRDHCGAGSGSATVPATGDIGRRRERSESAVSGVTGTELRSIMRRGRRGTSLRSTGPGAQSIG